jgi:hypothetical protein
MNKEQLFFATNASLSDITLSHEGLTDTFIDLNPIEKCVLCDKETNYRFNDHIDYRVRYIEGAGQLCIECYNK